MMKIKTIFRPLLLFIAASAITACERSAEVEPLSLSETSIDNITVTESSVIHHGPAKAIGKGVARTWIEVSKDGTPVSIGINFSSKAATSENLPLTQTMYHLEFPERVKFAPFKGMMFDWNPGGHIPMEMYGKPHFDFHFYMISEMEHMAIPLDIDHPHAEWFARDYMPADYSSLYLAIPGMGNHWVANDAPEYTEAGFSKTMILGAYKDKQIFVEPMITLEYLQSLKPNETVKSAISQFPKVQNSGYYPRSYTVTHTARGEYKIALTDLYYREAK